MYNQALTAEVQNGVQCDWMCFFKSVITLRVVLFYQENAAHHVGQLTRQKLFINVIEMCDKLKKTPTIPTLVSRKIK